MRRNTLLIGLLAVVMLTCSCRSKWREQTGRDGVRAVSDTLPRSGCLLPLPDVPVSLTAPDERAAYIIAHFWDRMDFSDTLRCRNRAFMEQNFVNYLSLFPHAKPEASPTHIARLLERAAADSICLGLVNDLAEHYLDDPNSPMRDEEYYILFLEGFLQVPELPEVERMRCSYSLKIANKNRKGSKATNFKFVTSNTSQQRALCDVDSQWLLLIFYDPECSHCSETLDRISASDNLNQMIAAGLMNVLAIYTEGKRDVWEKSNGKMPKNWTVGYDCSGIVDNDLYYIDAMPTLYLLDKTKTVVLKDPTLSALDRWILQNISNK